MRSIVPVPAFSGLSRQCARSLAGRVCSVVVAAVTAPACIGCCHRDDGVAAVVMAGPRRCDDWHALSCERGRRGAIHRFLLDVARPRSGSRLSRRALLRLRLAASLSNPPAKLGIELSFRLGLEMNRARRERKSVKCKQGIIVTDHVHLVLRRGTFERGEGPRPDGTWLGGRTHLAVVDAFVVEIVLKVSDHALHESAAGCGGHAKWTCHRRWCSLSGAHLLEEGRVGA